MSALVAYYQAQTDEQNARAAQDRQQASLTGQQVANFDSDDYAKRLGEYASANAQNANAKLETANANVVPQEADARTTTAQAGANLENQQASSLRQQTPLQIASEALKNQGLGLQNDYYGPTQQANLTKLGNENALSTASLSANGTLGTTMRAQGGLAGDQTIPFSKLSPSDQLNFLLKNGGAIANGTFHYAEGTSNVGKADKKAMKPNASDTVPAMLTPGEAVLNKGAVDHYGEDMIKHMNNMGLMRQAAKAEHDGLMKRMKNKKKAA